MQKETIHQLVSKKNEEFERFALDTASSIIEQISLQQSKIEKAQDEIKQLRADLKSLEIKQMNAKDILGEE